MPIQRTHQKLIATIKSHLKDRSAPAKKLCDILLQDGSIEDLKVMDPAALAQSVGMAFQHIKAQKKSRHRVRIFDVGATKNPTATVLESHCEDMPFLVDSVLGEVLSSGLEVHLVLHPIISVRRNAKGALTAFMGGREADGQKESLIQIFVDPLTSAQKTDMRDKLDGVLLQVERAVIDWPTMMDTVDTVIAEYQQNPPPVAVDELAEAIQFLQWVADDNFLFLGMREYRYSTTRSKNFKVDPGTALGILRDPDLHVLKRGKKMVSISPEIREFLNRPEPLIVTKANMRSRVHRRAYLDYLGAKKFDKDGKLIGELRIVGLFTSTAYTQSATRIPYLRKKIAAVVSNSGYNSAGHSGKALMNILEHYPRDELFQIDRELLTKFSLSIMLLADRPRVKVLVRPDKFDRFVSILVFVPREKYTSDVRERIGAYLKDSFEGRLSAYYPEFPEGGLARVHYIIGRNEGVTPVVPQTRLEARVNEIITTWEDGFHHALRPNRTPEQAAALFERFETAYPVAYQHSFTPADAVADLPLMGQLTASDRISLDLYMRASEEQLSLKLFNLSDPVHLSERVPVLENMGFRVVSERSYTIRPTGDQPVWLHDMNIMIPGDDAHPLSEIKSRVEELFIAVWSGQAENDGFNALVLSARLNWRDIAVLRAVAHYMRQAGVSFSLDYMWEALGRYPAIAREVMALFHVRFGLSTANRERKERAAQEKILAALDAVVSLDDDRILRRFVNTVQSTLRTNFFQLQDGRPPATISFKIDSKAIIDLPAPRPYREIFVYSPRVAGVHLRFGPVARGGLRWSDRRQDYRTEVLGLVKAQQVKNAVIVPVGSKGGFFPKRLHGKMNREEFIAEGTESYKIFVNSLLDITDNLDGDKVLPPPNVIRHDTDDPYLVVAADKGTATFSDVANGLSANHDFWLGDAFASGGSAGYDHKKMGITARGAWEAVKRHFRELDRDIQTEPFTVVGVGDMSGDVFGNGMLLSKTTRLLAAFDHRDIFIDPNPDPAKSWVERKRLFDMGRSSWADYNTSLISAGGGVFSRSEKSIPLSKSIQTLLELPKSSASPQEVMTAILKADADLMWFGGIGTYVRSPDETNADADDRANDAIRITTDQLRVKAIGEGANLGVTQRARIEFGRKGGRCNSDAVDNSAGVNSSDVEVNIKIALGQAVRADKLDLKSRNRLLASMTDDVAALCLRNNYQQTLSISLTERKGLEDFAHQRRLMQSLERRDLLDREVEFLPDDLVLAERESEGEPLTRPEIGVLLAYCKITLFDDLLTTNVPDDPRVHEELIRYFPLKMQRKYLPEINSHRLRREIITTNLVNAMVNRMGATGLTQLVDKTGAEPAAIARAYVAVRHLFSLNGINDAIDALDTKIAGSAQLELYGAVQSQLLASMTWMLRNVDMDGPVDSVIDAYQDDVSRLADSLPKMLPQTIAGWVDDRAARYTASQVDAGLATKIANLRTTAMMLDIIQISKQTKSAAKVVAGIYFAIAADFRLDRLDNLARNLSADDYFDGLALDQARQTLATAHRQIVISVLNKKGKADIKGWMQQHQQVADRASGVVNSITDSGSLSIAKLSVAASLMADLARDD